MKLTPITILALKGTSPDFKEELAKAIGISVNTLYRHIIENNDSLTKAAALQLIRKETGLTDDQILMSEPVES